ncbi:DUF383-domain-containing protein [Fistulina hepatica ATCC 64428]|uniref:DUF383-domain-containing protein n=1 Tax=Fistulina hepatica ATCC 64428 TaxID=1128425 RepID=A0A0D7A1U9_9AGAR|nr:DUF383-domain-containing protein [Fistulina hepatica ATCC 64428]
MKFQLSELLGFLHDKNPSVRQIALSNLLPHTPTDAPHRGIFFAGLNNTGLKKTTENVPIRDLKLLCRDQAGIAHDAFRALVNLSDSSMLFEPLSEPSFLEFLVSYIISPQSVLADLAAMLLSNITASAVVCSALASLKIAVIFYNNTYYAAQSRSGSSPSPEPYPSEMPKHALALPLLVDAFVQGAALKDGDDTNKQPHKSALHFISNVFANLAANPAGRDFLFTPCSILGAPEKFPISDFTRFTAHPDKIRRSGVAATFKNCAFHAPYHRAFLSPESELVSAIPSGPKAPGVDVLPALLLPLAGPEEFDLEDQEKLPEPLQFMPSDKKREPEGAIRLNIVETLLLLCHTRWGRDYLRGHGTYEILRAAHEHETVDRISDAIEGVVNMIQRKEDASMEDEEAASLANATISPQNDSDDEDNRIEEI